MTATTEAPKVPEPDVRLDDKVDTRKWGRGLYFAWCQPDTASLISVFVIVLFVVKAQLVVGAVGAVGRPAVFFGLALFVLWVGGRFIPRIAGGVWVEADRDPIRVGVWAFVFILFLSIVPAWLRPLTASEANSVLRNIMLWLALVGVAMSATEGLRHRGRLDAVLTRLTYVAVFSAMIAAFQFFTGSDPTDRFIPPGLVLNETELGLAQARNSFNRVVGTASHAIEFGVVLSMVLPIAIHYAFYARTTNERFWRWVIVAMIAMAVPLSVSRSGIIATTSAMLVLMGVWSVRRRVQVAVSGGFAVVAFGAAIPGLLGTIRGLFTNIGQDTSIDARTADYEIAYDFIEQAPFFGRGLGTFTADQYLVLDNQYLLTTIESGVVGLFAVIGMFLLGIGVAQRTQRFSSHEETIHLARAIQAAFVAGMISAFTFDALFFFTFQSTFLLLLGVIGSLWKTKHVEPTGVKRRSIHAPDKPIKPMWPSSEWKLEHTGKP